MDNQLASSFEASSQISNWNATWITMPYETVHVSRTIKVNKELVQNTNSITFTAMKSWIILLFN